MVTDMSMSLTFRIQQNQALPEYVQEKMHA
jgi:hypothetical protein